MVERALLPRWLSGNLFQVFLEFIPQKTFWACAFGGDPIS
jgi:hypothetical protein